MALVGQQHWGESKRPAALPGCQLTRMLQSSLCVHSIIHNSRQRRHQTRITTHKFGEIMLCEQRKSHQTCHRSSCWFSVHHALPYAGRRERAPGLGEQARIFLPLSSHASSHRYSFSQRLSTASIALLQQGSEASFIAASSGWFDSPCTRKLMPVPLPLACWVAISSSGVQVNQQHAALD